MSETPSSPAKHCTIRAGAVSLAVTEYPGDGPPVVLLHGISAQSDVWYPVIDALTPLFHLYAIDLRGHGDSAKPDSGYDLADFAADLDAALDALDLARPRIIGHSLGALVTLTWATLHPPRAAALVLEDPPLRVAPPVVELMDHLLAESAMTPADLDAQYAAHFPDWSAGLRGRRIAGLLATNPVVFRETREQAEGIMAANGGTWFPAFGPLPPTLVIYGELAAGGMLPQTDVDQLVAAVPGLRASLIPGAGHNIHRDSTAEFLALAVPFLQAAS